MGLKVQTKYYTDRISKDLNIFFHDIFGPANYFGNYNLTYVDKT